MFQDASTNPPLPNSPKSTSDRARKASNHPHRTPEASNFSAESYANRLMDDLFQDIDQVLGKEPTQAVEPESPPDWPADIYEQPDLAQADANPHGPVIAPSPSIQSSPPHLQSLHQSAFSLATRPQLTSGQPANAVTGAENSGELGFQGIFAPVTPLPTGGSPPSARPYERLLLGVGCVSVIVTLALWLLHQEAHRSRPTVATGGAPIAASASVGTTNQFADYAQKALESIDQRASQAGTSQTSPNLALNSGLGNLANGNLPTVPIPRTGLPPVGQSRLSTGLERIYVPIYQPPQTLNSPGTAIAPLPMPKNPAASKFPSNAPNPSALNNPGKNPQRTTSMPTSVASDGITRRLAGVLSQGDRSAALFEISGVTQRYEVGESIGSSGWTLVEVSKDQAIIRRNGEVRSLFVGHGF